MDTIRVTLTPAAGFCVKSSALQPAVCAVTGQSAAASTQPASTLAASKNTITIATGQKVFINMAWDANVPPPPDASNDEIKKAMAGEQDPADHASAGGGGWFVPVVVSEPRNDIDKAGKPSIVFDCVYNKGLKSRCLRDPNFRAFLVELGLQRIEAQHSVALSRQLSTPNIASKGKLAPRTALVPLRLYPDAHPLREESAKRKASLIQELDSSSPQARSEEKSEYQKPKSILKNTASANPANVQISGETIATDKVSADARPPFEWVKDGDRIRISVQIHNATRVQVENATLDVEPRRVVLYVPSSPPYTLDIDLSMSDAQIAAIFGGTSNEGSALMLKRQRDFDVDGAKAEWNVQEAKLTILV